jgi:hypothetical protein
MTKADVPLAAFALLLAVGCDEPSPPQITNPFDIAPAAPAETLLPYPDTRQSLEKERKALKAAYTNSESDPQKELVLDEARRALRPA